MNQEKTGVSFHIHLVSDATGETLNAVAKAACAQFEGSRPTEHVYALVRSARQLERALKDIENAPGIVLCTMMNEELRDRLEAHCQRLGMPCLSVLDPVLSALASYLGIELSHKSGGQHALTAEYFQRMDALNYTMSHDDGQNVEDFEDADVVLLGVSRTSKTPTCIYLANRGFKAANVPIVKDMTLSPAVERISRPLVVGLTITTHRLLQIRRQRLLSMKVAKETTYIDEQEVQKEIVFARKLFDKHGWPVLDVSRRSIEETAATIINMISKRHEERTGEGTAS